VNRREERVAVIGGGLSGLVIAEGLQKKGYKHVTVFEKDSSAGGKLHTIWYKGRSYEMGAIFGLPSQKHLKALMKTFNIKIDGPKLVRVNYDAYGNKIMQIPKDKLRDFVDELDRLPEVLAEYKSLECISIHNLEPSLMLPFSQWCELHGFAVLKTVYGHYFTSYGLGYIEEVPALYVLRILNYDNLMYFMDLPEFFTWKDGVSSLIECLKGKILDIRLGQKVTRISKTAQGKLCVYTDFEELEFDKVVITSPLYEISDVDGWDEEMKQLINTIRYQDFHVYAFIVDKAPKGCGCILENLSIENRGHIIIWNTRWDSLRNEELIMVYAYGRAECSNKEALEIIKGDLSKLGIESPRLYKHVVWQQCPHADSGILKRGFYEKMEEVQGKNNIFIAGEIMSTVSMENSIRYSNYLIEKYF